MNIVNTTKYEVVIGIPDDKFVNGKIQDHVKIMIDKWQEYAKEYYDKTGVYVSAIANEGKAIYNKDWGCPDGGERTLTFNCTANTVAFIKSISEYEKGICFIVGKMKKEFEQHTITITSIAAKIDYFTDEDNEKFDELINIILKEENSNE